MFYWYLQALKKFANFKGRARRREYGFYVLSCNVVFLVMGIFFYIYSYFILGTAPGAEPNFDNDSFLQSMIVLFALYILFSAVAYVSVTVRRLHDIEMPGLLVLVGFVPFINGIFQVILALADGKPGENKYGPNPKNIVQPAPPPLASYAAAASGSSEPVVYWANETRPRKSESLDPFATQLSSPSKSYVCLKCNTKTSEQHKFCSRCGTPLTVV